MSNHGAFRRSIPSSRVGIAALLALVVGCASGATAQVIEPDPGPPTHGQWAGPWVLENEIVSPLIAGPPYVPDVKEIAHSIVLPPPSTALAGSSPFGGWVVFMNRRSQATLQQVNNPQPTFLWNPSVPDQIHAHLNVPGDLTKDIFCSGHTYLGDGRPVSAGGQDNVNPPPSPAGAGQSYVLRTDLAVSAATPPAWELYGNLATERWYPTVTTLANGSLLQTGDSKPGNCAGHDCGDEFRQVLDLSGASPTWMPDLLNQRFVGTSGCNVAEAHHVLHYPRLHLLGSGELMLVDGKQTAHPHAHVAWFLKVDATLPLDCATLPGNPYQWREGAPAPGDTLGASQKGAPSVHLLWPDSGQLDEWAEVVYQFGGTIEPEDDTALCPPLPAATVSATDRVARMVNPAANVPWDLSLEPMADGRINHNAVILLDGSVLIVGGNDPVEEDVCEYRTTPERFKPPEIFGGPGAMTWKNMDPQIGERNYHSVAGLLPDGRVFSAGGSDPENRYTVELYSPPYMFTLPRPVILTSFTSAFDHGTPLVFDVKVRGGGEVERVALVRIGTATHAFDMSQRYIELEVIQLTSLGNETWQVDSVLPPNGNVAPPGWYMLTAVGGLQQTPSAAKWIKLE
jgi:hypothetical protein